MKVHEKRKNVFFNLVFLFRSITFTNGFVANIGKFACFFYSGQSHLPLSCLSLAMFADDWVCI